MVLNIEDISPSGVALVRGIHKRIHFFDEGDNNETC